MQGTAQVAIKAQHLEAFRVTVPPQPEVEAATQSVSLAKLLAASIDVIDGEEARLHLAAASTEIATVGGERLIFVSALPRLGRFVQSFAVGVVSGERTGARSFAVGAVADPRSLSLFLSMGGVACGVVRLSLVCPGLLVGLPA